MSQNLSRIHVCLIIPFFIVSCITVNVNFPEGAVQKAADDYVRELYRAKPKPKTPTSSKGAGDLLWGAWVPTASANSSVAIRVNTSKTREIQGRQAGRLEEILEWKKKGVLGESIQGLLVVREVSGLKPLLLKKVENLVQSENSDRNELYSEVLKANEFPESRRIDIQKSFSRSFQAESPSGTWLENSEGTWSQKP